MVFITSCLLRKITFSVPARGPDRYWKRRKVLNLSANFYGRKQNCYKIAVQAVNKALKQATLARSCKHDDLKEIFNARITAACEEHGFDFKLFKESLIRSNVLLNAKILSDLAIWEPRTFKCLTEFAWKKASEEKLKGVQDFGDPPSGVILKPMDIK